MAVSNPIAVASAALAVALAALAGRFTAPAPSPVPVPSGAAYAVCPVNMGAVLIDTADALHADLINGNIYLIPRDSTTKTAPDSLSFAYVVPIGSAKHFVPMCVVRGTKLAVVATFPALK